MLSHVHRGDYTIERHREPAEARAPAAPAERRPLPPIATDRPPNVIARRPGPRDAVPVIRHLLAAVVLLCACTDRRTEPPTGDTSVPPHTKTARPHENTCMPAGLESAKPLETVLLPGGCRWTAPGSLDAPARIADAAQLEAALACDPPATRPALDLAAVDLEVAEFSMSPAYAGIEAVDDGTTVTFVERQRSPCPDDPLPMPMQTTFAYRIPNDAKRVYRTLACTLPPSCSYGPTPDLGPLGDHAPPATARLLARRPRPPVQPRRRACGPRCACRRDHRAMRESAPRGLQRPSSRRCAK